MKDRFPGRAATRAAVAHGPAPWKVLVAIGLDAGLSSRAAHEMVLRVAAEAGDLKLVLDLLPEAKYAFCMGWHDRLGAKSLIRRLPRPIFEKISRYVYDIDINALDKHNGNALRAAVYNPRKNNNAIVALLLEHGAKDLRRPGESAVLYGACRRGNLDAVRLLLDAGDVDASLALHCASGNGHTDVMELLLARGADIDKADSYGETALYQACRNGDEETFRFLLGHGASINKGNRGGSTPLICAVEQKRVAMTTLLLESGASVDQADNNGLTPLLAACRNGHPALLKRLVDHGAPVTEECERAFPHAVRAIRVLQNRRLPSRTRSRK